MPRVAFSSLVGLLQRVAGNQRGNTFVIVAAAIIPMLALVGGGIDMSRGYLTRTRLQQACDAGVLATRKKVGSTVITTGTIPTDANAAGARFFNLNFRDGSYGTTGRTFSQTMSSDYSINGIATANVPTTVMQLFGRAVLPVTVNCSAQFNYANTDIMMVLDTTGSMTTVNSGDTMSRIAVLRQTVKDFHATVESNKSQGVRIRYGFVPYATNVNVGYLLKSGWMVSQANYERRTAVNTGTSSKPNWKWRYGSAAITVSGLKGTTSEALYKGGSVTVKMNGTPAVPTNLTATFSGCIEERATYNISDYDNVDLDRARDLDIDSVPSQSDPDTQWRPILNGVTWARARTGGWGDYWSPADIDYAGDYESVSSPCPAAARKLAEMSRSEVASYIGGLVASGNTYHDIGMIWGGRLLSPSGIFASENGEVQGRPTMRHLIFLTDGKTEPNEEYYGTYGLEPLARRRWASGSKYNLTQTVEKRFTFACDQVKNRNITVWVIGFGTSVTTMLKNCAGSGHWFQADNSTELSNAFSAIAAAIGDLRIIK